MSHFVLMSHIHIRDALDDATRSDTGCAAPRRLPRTATLIAGSRDGPTRSFLQGRCADVGRRFRRTVIKQGKKTDPITCCHHRHSALHDRFRGDCRITLG